MSEVDGLLADRHRSEHPFERRAATRQCDELGVAGLAGVVHPLRQHLDEVHLGRSGREQAGQDVGMAVTQEVAQPGQEGVGVADLGGAAAVPVEGVPGIGRHGSVVPLDQDDVVAVTGREQRRAEAGHPCTNHDHPCHAAPLSTAAARPCSCPAPDGERHRS